VIQLKLTGSLVDVGVSVLSRQVVASGLSDGALRRVLIAQGSHTGAKPTVGKPLPVSKGRFRPRR
jgi:hypothetical protein